MKDLKLDVIINNYSHYDYTILLQNNNNDLSKTLAEIGIYIQEALENGDNVKIEIEREEI